MGRYYYRRIRQPAMFLLHFKVKAKFGYDDALDAFGCHGIGGIWGGITTGLFAKSSINPTAQWNGLVYGETKLFMAQIISILITIAIAAAATFVIVFVLKRSATIRVSQTEEAQGLDISERI